MRSSSAISRTGVRSPAISDLHPVPGDRGAVSRDQGIQRSGNPCARRTAIELAWLLLRHQPDSGVARWFQERVGAGKGRIRRTMIVALARKLVVALWRYLTQGLLPQGATTQKKVP